MSKKLLTTILAISLVVPAAFAKKAINEKPVVNDNRVQVLTPDGRQVPNNQVRVQKYDAQGLEVVPVKTRPNPSVGAADATREDPLWNLKHVDDNAEYYLGSGGAGDTFAIVFNPAAPAVVKEVYSQWYSAGNCNAFGADYSAGAASLSPDGECSTILRGESPYSPIGQMRTTITPNSIDGYHADWTYPLDIGGEFIVGDSTDLSNVPPFVIAFVKGGNTPQPLANSTDGVGGVTYTWFGGPWNSTTTYPWGRYSGQTDISMLVKVTYPWGAPISVQTLSQMNNTYNTTGPFTVVADLFDDPDDSGMAIDSNDEIVFHYTVNGGGEVTGSLTASSIGADGNGLYSYDISGNFAVGDVIEYWISTVDNDGLESTSITLGFSIKEPANPDADLLIIADGANDNQQAIDLYRMAADDAGLVYEYWVISDESGIDASVINAGWTNIIVYGWGNKTVPAIATETDPGYATFMDNGGDLILVDQDWFFGHGLDANITFAAGDFAYDYFGLGSGTNDPVDANNVSTADTVLLGFGVTPMDSPFSGGLTLNHTIYGTTNYGDPIDVANGTAIFAGQNDGLTYGAVYDNGTSKGAYLGFMIDAAVDSLADGTMTYDAVFSFLNGAFEWMGVTTPPQITGVAGPSGTVLAGPYDVMATIIDADGDAITATMMWSADGDTWNSVAMTADGSDYSAQIPNVSEAGFYYWFISATAAGETSTSPGMDSEPYMFERFAPSAPVLINFNGGEYAGYPGEYYFAPAPVPFDFDIWEKGLSSELASAYTSIFEINTGGPNWDNRDVITAWLAEGSKNYFLAGDEWFGALSNWTNMDFAAGDFEYDVLGVASSLNDINASSTGATAIEAVSGNELSGGMYATHTAAGDILMNDPYYEIGVANWLDGVVPVNANDVNMTTFETTPVAIGLHRVVGDDKVVFLGFDPLSINATPYTWYGYTADALQITALDYFNITSADEEGAKLPTEFALAQNYPNPFNPTTTVAFSVPSASNVTIAVYNLLGQKVLDLVNNAYQPGQYNVNWNGTDALGKAVSSGVYFYRMNADGFTAQHKMLYLK